MYNVCSGTVHLKKYNTLLQNTRYIHNLQIYSVLINYVYIYIYTHTGYFIKQAKIDLN